MTYGRPTPIGPYAHGRHPLSRAGRWDLVYIFMPQDIALLTMLQAIYPTGQATVHQDRYGMPLFLSFAVPGRPGRGARAGGQLFADSAPGATPVLTATVASLEQAFAVAPVDRPGARGLGRVGVGAGVRRVRFPAPAEDGMATLQIGVQIVFAYSQRRRVAGRCGDVTLAAGFHPVRITFTHTGAMPGGLRVDWSGPDFAGQPLGAGALYTVDFGNQGLVGDHYPNGDWQGEPAFVRSDLIPTPFSPLAVPYSIRWRGQIVVPLAGLYEFSTVSDDGSLLYVNGQLVVDNSGSHGAQERQGAVNSPGS